MPRRSPRARAKPDPAPRLPAKARPRTSPGTRRKAAAQAAGKATAAAKGRSKARRATATPKPAPRSGAHGKPPRPSGRKLPSAGRGRGRFKPRDPAQVQSILDILAHAHPDATTALNFENPLQLLVATILSAQCTDARVNQVTPELFRRYPDAAALAAVPQEELEQVIRSTGFFRNKSRAIRECCADIVTKHGGQVPRTLEELTKLRGVGRKTANVVLGNAFGIPGLVVDTHVSRVSHRLGLTRESDPEKIEFSLMPQIPKERWTVFSHWLILHGRQICVARKPRCSICPLATLCPRIGVSASV